MAEFSISNQHALAVSIDTMVAGVHFHDTMSGIDVGYKLIAVNLSDLAAMGAEPIACDILRSYPTHNQDWIETFDQATSDTLHTHGDILFERHSSKGPLCVSVQIYGEIDEHKALLRSGAQLNDAILVTGTLGDAAGALDLALSGESPKTDDEAYLLHRLCRPTARIDVGIELRGIATAAIDISDGLLADLGHLVKASGVGAVLDRTALPLSESLCRTTTLDAALCFACSGGDDYELCFTCASKDVEVITQRVHALGVRCTRIGQIVAGKSVTFNDNQAMSVHKGYDHFR